MEVMLGTGLATGMCYHAPAGTALPTYPSETLNKAWVKVGDVSSDGITMELDKSTDTIKNWANVVKRNILTDHTETVQVPIIDTTEQSLKTVLGEGNVKVTEATAEHGKLIDAHLSISDLPKAEAFLFLMKDGDDMIALGTSDGQITALESVSFAPNNTITWTPTITGMKDGWHMITDDGQKAS